MLLEILCTASGVETKNTIHVVVDSPRRKDVVRFIGYSIPSSVLKLRLTGSGCSFSAWSPPLAKMGRGFLGEGGMRSNPND